MAAEEALERLIARLGNECAAIEGAGGATRRQRFRSFNRMHVARLRYDHSRNAAMADPPLDKLTRCAILVDVDLAILNIVRPQKALRASEIPTGIGPPEHD